MWNDFEPRQEKKTCVTPLTQTVVPLGVEHSGDPRHLEREGLSAQCGITMGEGLEWGQDVAATDMSRHTQYFHPGLLRLLSQRPQTGDLTEIYTHNSRNLEAED